jgi:hypothetical protein
MVVADTPAEGDGIFLHMRLNCPSGDVIPNPAPSRFPVTPIPSYLGATGDVNGCPLKLWDVNYKAPGKSTIELIMQQEVAVGVAPIGAMGIIFGNTRPAAKFITFIDRVAAQVTSAAITAVGTITIAEGAKMITHVGGVIGHDNVLTAAEQLIGIFTLASDDIVFPPSEYPFQAAFGGGEGALVNQGLGAVPVLIPVNIPVVGGARIDASVDLHLAQTNAASVSVFIAYE